MYSNSNRSSSSHLTTLSAFCDKCLPSLGRHRYLPGGGSLGQQQRQPQHIRTTATAVAALTALIAAATVPGATGSKWCGGSRTSDRTAAGKFVQKGNVQTGCRDFCTHRVQNGCQNVVRTAQNGRQKVCTKKPVVRVRAPPP